MNTALRPILVASVMWSEQLFRGQKVVEAVRIGHLFHLLHRMSQKSWDYVCFFTQNEGMHSSLCNRKILYQRLLIFYLVHVSVLIPLFHIKTDWCTDFKSCGLREIYNKLLTKLNFTSGNSFRWPCCWNISVVIHEDGTLRAETCWRDKVLIKWW